LLSALAVALFLALLEGVASWTYAIAKTREQIDARKRPEHRHAQHDEMLGWVNVPKAFVRDAYGAGKNFTANAAGFRAREEYTREVPRGRKRVLFAGDSFTMGFGVGDDDTYPAQIERIEPRIQSANLAMGAYGVDQAWLSLRSDAAQIEKDAIVLAFIAHDFRRMELDFYMAPKPRLALRSGKLEVENAPVPERSAKEDTRFALRQFFTLLDLGKLLGRATRALAPAAPRASVADASFPPLARALFGELAQESARAGVPVLLAFIPTRGELREAEVEIRDWTQREAAKAGLPYFDATPAFANSENIDSLYLEDGHLSEAGNAALAAAMLPALRELLVLAAPE
jgi:lysophospholipase L1-like esterase